MNNVFSESILWEIKMYLTGNCKSIKDDYVSFLKLKFMKIDMQKDAGIYSRIVLYMKEISNDFKIIKYEYSKRYAINFHKKYGHISASLSPDGSILEFQRHIPPESEHYFDIERLSIMINGKSDGSDLVGIPLTMRFTNSNITCIDSLDIQIDRNRPRKDSDIKVHNTQYFKRGPFKKTRKRKNY